MTRNVFESNTPWVTPEDQHEMVDKTHSVLPPLAEGYRYDLVKLASGRSAIVVEEDHKENTELERAFPERDLYGRHKL